MQIAVKTELLSKTAKVVISCYQLLSSCYHWHRYQLFWKNDSSENSVVEFFSMSHEFVLVLGLNQLTVPK